SRRSIGTAASSSSASASASGIVSRMGRMVSIIGGSSSQLAHEMSQLGHDQFVHAEPYRVLGSRQHEDRRAARDPADRARQHRGAANFLIAQAPEDLAETCEPLVYQALDRLARAVARGDAGAAGRDHRVDATELRGHPRMHVGGLVSYY